MDNTTLGAQPPSAAACLDAQTFLGSQNEYGNGELNPDVGGFCVAIANIVMNLLLPFLVAWSPDVSTPIFLLFSQTIPTLIATLSSINTDNLSLFDAHFTVAVTASPMSVYVAFCCILHIFRINTSLFGKLSSVEARRLILGLGLILPWLWLSVNAVTSFSATAYRNSEYCRGMTVARFLEFNLVSSVAGALDVLGRRDLYDDLSKRYGLGLLSVLGIWTWGIYLVRHREEIYHCSWKRIHSLRREAEMTVTPRSSDKHQVGAKTRRPDTATPTQYTFMTLCLEHFRLLWRVPIKSWQVIVAKHPAMLVWMFLCLHWSWTLGISKAIVLDRNQLSYGQLLSLFSAVPCVWQFLKIVISHRGSIINFVKNLPGYISQGLCFIVSGRDEWGPRPVEDEFERDYFHWSRRRWFFIIIGCLVWIGLHIVWIYIYVRTGTMPNNRNGANDPHSAWKPFSVTMFISGYFTSIICMFLWIASLDLVDKRDAVTLLPNFSSPRSPTHPVVDTICKLLLFVLGTVICAAPLFSPYAALPLSQQWHYDHQCDGYTTEAVLEGQANMTRPSIISFYISPQLDGHNHHERALLYQFNFTTLPFARNLKSIVLASSPPKDSDTPVQSLVLDTNSKMFCSSGSWQNLTDRSTAEEYLSQCPGDWGRYAESPFLSFAINSTTSTQPITYLQAESREYAYSNDAPSFSLRRAESFGASTRPTGSIVLRSALTKRNEPHVLKVCVNSTIPSTEILAPLGVAMVALNQFSLFIARPRVYSL